MFGFRKSFDVCDSFKGVPFAIRQVAGALKPTITISKQGDMVICKQQSTFKNSEISFRLGEEFDETTPDGRQCKVRFGDLLLLFHIWQYRDALCLKISCVTFDQSIVVMDGDRFVQVQKWNGKETTYAREMKDGKMIAVSIYYFCTVYL